MTPEQFAYWLQGFAEVSGETPTEEQWQEIKNHLALVFNKISPTLETQKLTQAKDWMGRSFPELYC